jgi:hypothetical protein
MCPRDAIDGEIFCDHHKAAAILHYDFHRTARYPEPATRRQRATIADLAAQYPEKAHEVELAMNAYNKPGWYYRLDVATKGEAMWIIAKLAPTLFGATE